MRRKQLTAMGVFLCVLGLTGCAQNPGAPQHPLPEEPGLIHDAFRYPTYKDGAGDFVYAQMWNFSWLDDRDTPYDATDDAYGVVAFGLANPDNLMGTQGLTTTLGLIIRPQGEGETFLIQSPYYNPSVPGNFSASETFAPAPGYELVNPNGLIDVISEDEFRVFGHVTDGMRTMVWDLTYSRNLDPGWLPWVEWPLPATLGIFPAWMTYYIHMPNAWVNGYFAVSDGVHPDVTYELSGAKGYHDGFYGEFVFSMLEWDWLDYKQPGLSVHLLHPHGPVYACEGGWSPCTPGNLRVFCNGTAYDFVRHRDTIEILYEETVFDLEFGIQYPTRVNVRAEDALGNVLDLVWEHA